MSQPRILVVDDDIVLCQLLRETLELEGMVVDEAHHVVEADRILLEHVPDAIVLDIGLPASTASSTRPACGRTRRREACRSSPSAARR